MSESHDLRSPALQTLALGELRPAGWLARQLRLQADGMAGHLDEFWPDVADSAWLGGSAEGWERGPYWLDAVVPLGFLLDDARLIAKVRRWVDYILDHQAADGWLGPGDAGDDVWPRMVLLKALLQFHSATGDERILPACLRFARLLETILPERPLHAWGRVRWADLIWSLHRLHDLTGAPWLLDLAGTVRAQGYDWMTYADRSPYPEKVTEAKLKEYQQAAGAWMNDDFLASHGVNVAMGLKALAVWWRQSEVEPKRFDQLLEWLDAHHGQATGVFTGDEHLAGKHPSQGTETCAVVELLLSLGIGLETWGVQEPVIDRWERIAFNALPASATSDEWSHQYDQQANQIACHVTEDRIYTNNGPDANVFGLEPHFGCCTANRHQGWPKFAARAWMRTPDDGLLALTYAPADLRTTVRGEAVEIDVRGEYPFSDEVTLTVRAGGVCFPLQLRVPEWVEGATLTIDDNPPVDLVAGSLHEVDREWSGEQVLRLRLPARVRTEERYAGSVAVHRGPLVFALAVRESWWQFRGEQPHADWEVHPTSSWNYALELDPAALEPSLQLERKPAGERPFSPDGVPVRLHARARRVPEWGRAHGAADAPPMSPVRVDRADSDADDVVLLPYGAARLRVTELPWLTADAPAADALPR